MGSAACCEAASRYALKMAQLFPVGPYFWKNGVGSRLATVARALAARSETYCLCRSTVAEVARGLSAGVSLASGILPGDEAGPNTLFCARSSGSTRLGIWVGPRVWRMTLRSFEPGGKDRRLRLAFPGLVFVCRPDATGAYVFSAAKRPRNSY